MLMIFFDFLLFIIFTRAVTLSRKTAYHQITDLCYRKTKAIMAPIFSLLFALHLFEGTNSVINLFYSRVAHLKSITSIRTLGLQSSTRHYNKTTSPNTILCIVHSVVDVIRDGF